MIDGMPIRSRLPLVGRDDELSRARHALGLDDGRGGLLLLGGDAGIGKTALVAALVDEVVDAGTHRLAIGHCVGEAGTALPYLPFVELFSRLDDVEPGTVEALLAGLPSLARLLPRRAGDPSGTGAAAEAERGRLLEAVHGALESLARERPLLVVVEDLHWADESSRDLLTLLFTRGFAGPLSLVATYRSDDLHRRHPLRGSLTVWSRLSALSRLDLDPLPDPDVASLVRSLGTDLPGEVVDGVVRRAEGNAFFAEELAAAAAQGVAAELTDLSRLLLSRVEMLDDDAQEVVRVAAVVGRRVPHALLERVAGVDGPALDRLVRQAVEHHVLEPLGADGYAFRHALLAEAVYDDLLPSEKLRLHRACSAAIQQDPGIATRADLARHALAAGEVGVAASASLEAGWAALRVGGPAEALVHFDRGLGLVDVADTRSHDLTLGAVDAALGGGRTHRALGYLRDRLAQDVVVGPARAELLGRLSYVLRLTEDRTDRDALTTEALSLLDGATQRQRVEVLVRRAEYLADAERHDEAASAAQDAMEAATALGGGLYADLTTVVARLSFWEGDPAESIRRLEDLVARSDAAADLPVIRAMHTIGTVHYRQENLEAALAAYRTCSERAAAMGLPWAPYATDSRAMAVAVAYELGEWDLALRLADTREEDAPAFACAAFEAAVSYVHAARGSDLPARWYPQLREFWERDGLCAIQSGAAMVDTLGYAGDVAGARAAHREVVDFVRGLWGQADFAGEVRLAALLLGRLADAAPGLPSREVADVLAEADRLAAHAATIFAPGSPRPAPNTEGLAWAARARGEHLRLRWRARAEVPPEELRAAWTEAASLFEARGDPYETARSRAGLAEVLAASGDREGAAQQARAARSAAAALGAAPLLARIDRSVVTGGGAGPGPIPSGGLDAAPSLTARELEVLALVAQGRSNGQIGGELFISTKTASVHVSNILAKLGARTRGEAAALARDRGLLG